MKVAMCLYDYELLFRKKKSWDRSVDHLRRPFSLLVFNSCCATMEVAYDFERRQRKDGRRTRRYSIYKKQMIREIAVSGIS